MVFSSIIFIFAFLPVTLLLYYAAPEVLKNPVLLLFSLISTHGESLFMWY